jgi:hypothetical protein
MSMHSIELFVYSVLCMSMVVFLTLFHLVGAFDLLALQEKAEYLWMH